MRLKNIIGSGIVYCVAVLLAALPGRAATPAATATVTNTLVWHQDTGLVDAEVHGVPLWPLLENIAHQTGWHIFVEPTAVRQASARFSGLPSGDALHRLLGNLNFAFLPQTNGPDFLYVFTTRMENATRAVAVKARPAKHVSKQLIIRIKPGADIDAIAKSVGAKVIARNDKLHLYKLEFDTDAATDTALGTLQSNPDVLAVDYNYEYDPPPMGTPLTGVSGGPTSLSLDPSTDTDPCSPIVGLIDTAYQPQGNPADSIIKPPISVVGDYTPPAPASGVAPLHGTAMAQYIMQAVAQQANGATSTKVRILPVDVYGASETTTSWNVALGIQAAVDGGASVLSMSLGSSGQSSVEASLIADAASRGIVMFAAAGNTPVDTPTYPAANPGVIAVTASQNGQLAPYANYGSFVSLELPGASVMYVGNQAWGFQGTSVSTALAAGVAAGVKSYGGCPGWSQVESAMQAKFPFNAATAK